MTCTNIQSLSPCTITQSIHSTRVIAIVQYKQRYNENIQIQIWCLVDIPLTQNLGDWPIDILPFILFLISYIDNPLYMTRIYITILLYYICLIPSVTSWSNQLVEAIVTLDYIIEMKLLYTISYQYTVYPYFNSLLTYLAINCSDIQSIGVPY